MFDLHVPSNILQFTLGKCVTIVPMQEGNFDLYEARTKTKNELIQCKVDRIGHVTGFSTNAQNEVLIIVKTSDQHESTYHPSRLVVIG